MNKAFLVNSTLVIALSVLTSANANTLANPQEGVPVEIGASKKILMNKLANLSFFSADFTQEVISEGGELLEQSAGKMVISKPNLANWHTQEPDELSIVSDGEDVWFYNPWIEQVSVYSLSAAIAKTPILLLTSRDESLWQQYAVTQEKASETKLSQQGERFVISANDPNSQIKSLTLVFSPNDHKTQKNKQDNRLENTLSQFSFLDATGQVSHIYLSNFDASTIPDKHLFNFTVPQDVQIDDQRAN